MEIVVNSVCLLLFAIIELTIYAILISSVLPKRIVKVQCSVKESTDRGLKKYSFPSGRGVVYEPRPFIRKYVDKYVLFTHDGYKYLKCHIDDGVKELNYSVVMFNNQNEVIDVVDVNEKKGDKPESETLLIHQDTSYISFILNSVNGAFIEEEPPFYCRVKDVLIYAAVVSAISFVELVFVMKMIDIFDKWLLSSLIAVDISVLTFVIPALLIGALAGGLLYFHNFRKGVRWSR